MSELYLLDTKVFLPLIRGRALGSFIDSTFGLSTSKQQPAVSVGSHGEIRVLASRNGWGEDKLDTLQRALDDLVTVDINVADLSAFTEGPRPRQQLNAGFRSRKKPKRGRRRNQQSRTRGRQD